QDGASSPCVCEINVSNMAIDFVMLLVGLCGLAGNGLILWLLHVNAITHFISKQAIIDFLFLIFMLPSTLLFLVEEVSCSAIMPLMYLSLLFQLSLFTYIIGLYRLTFISIQRCRSILCLVFCGCQLPEHLLWVLMTALFWVLLFVFIQEHCRALCWGTLISMYTIMLLLFAAPLVISHTVDFINAKRDILIFITVLLTLLNISNFLLTLGYINVSSEVFFLLTYMHNSIKPFFYFLAGRCRWPCSMESLRLSLQRVFEEPKEKSDHKNDPAMDMEV
uniref:MAS protein n=1 Tax=Junco hyemalis TaxID=40217 RepID=A0A8C5ISW7_JUNHY